MKNSSSRQIEGCRRYQARKKRAAKMAAATLNRLEGDLERKKDLVYRLQQEIIGLHGEINKLNERIINLMDSNAIKAARSSRITELVGIIKQLEDDKEYYRKNACKKPSGLPQISGTYLNG